MTNAGAIPQEGGGVSLFGITMTSRVLGVLIGVAGVGLAGFGYISVVDPLKTQVDGTEISITQKKSTVDQLRADVAKGATVDTVLKEAQEKNAFVLTLLPSVDNVDTLLKDITDQLPKSIEVSLPPFSYRVPNSLQSFTLAPAPTVVPVGQQFRTISVNVAMDAPFPDILASLQKIERLQPLLAIKNLKLAKKTLPPEAFQLPEGFGLEEAQKAALLESLPPLLTATFVVEAYVPLSAEELAAQAAAAPQ
jgi:type IV pilus assembly protein PilO